MHPTADRTVMNSAAPLTLSPRSHPNDKHLLISFTGFYSQDFNHQIPEKLKHIGIRIEDDVLVAKDGYEYLSIDTVKEIDDVEDMVKSGK